MPVTSPDNDPVKLVAFVAVVAVAALPFNVAVIIPALKLPDPLRNTNVFGVLELVAVLASDAAVATFAALCPPTKLTTVAPCVPVTSPANDPVKPVELPTKFAVIVPALKLPDPSLFTIVLAVLELVDALAKAVAAPTFAAVWPATKLTTVAFCVPVTSPDKLPVKLPAKVAVPFNVAVIVPALKFPDAFRFTIVFAVFALVAAFAAELPDATFAAVWPPTKLTTVADCVPVTSPESEPEKLVADVAFPFNVAVIVPALKLPDPLRFTRVLGVLALVAFVVADTDVATLVAL